MRSRSRSVGATALALAAACVVVGIAAGRPSAPTRVTVTMVDYRFRLSQRTVHTGTVVFSVVNKGELPHTFEIQRLHRITPLLQPGQRATLRVSFKKPGRYYYLCTVGNHVLYGMAGYLRVIA
jgi:plastocyanin